MSETCHPGIAYILQLYTEEQSRVDTALTHNVCHTFKEDGMRGMELPYQLRSDWMAKMEIRTSGRKKSRLYS